MPTVKVVLYREADGTIPFLEWFESLSPKMQDKVRVKIERLAQLGHELHRPEAEYLTNGIYELRAIRARVRIRVLYFFHGRSKIVVSHGFVKKQQQVPARELRRALIHMASYRLNPDLHTSEDL